MKCALLELCLASPDAAALAAQAGVDRLELNAALELGGLTPSPGLLREVRSSVTIPIIAMVRPRAGGFHYDGREWRVMLRDAETMLEHGADGIAFGALDSSGQVNVARCREMIQLLGEREAVFHRAFDLTPDPLKVMEKLIDLGIRRILTSGQATTAPQGASLIRQLIQQARGRIEILPGAGIRPHNLRALIEATGCTQVHASLSRPSAVASTNGVDFGAPLTTDLDQVRAMVAALRNGV